MQPERADDASSTYDAVADFYEQFAPDVYDEQAASYGRAR